MNGCSSKKHLFLTNYYELIVVYDGLQEIGTHCLRPYSPKVASFNSRRENKMMGKRIQHSQNLNFHAFVKLFLKVIIGSCIGWWPKKSLLTPGPEFHSNTTGC